MTQPALLPPLGKVLKPGPDSMVRPGKPRTAHFCGSLSHKNPFMAKKIGTRENRGQTSRFWESWSDRFSGSLLHFWIWTLKKKKKKKKKNQQQQQQQHRKTSFKFYSLQSRSWWWRGLIVGANGLCRGDRRNEGFQRRRKDGCYRSLRLSLVICWIDGTAIFSP